MRIAIKACLILGGIAIWVYTGYLFYLKDAGIGIGIGVGLLGLIMIWIGKSIPAVSTEETIFRSFDPATGQGAEPLASDEQAQQQLGPYVKVERVKGDGSLHAVHYFEVIEKPGGERVLMYRRCEVYSNGSVADSSDPDMELPVA